MILIRNLDKILQTHGRIENGTFHDRWHFSFGENYDPENIHFGTLRIFNDDILSLSDNASLKYVLRHFIILT